MIEKSIILFFYPHIYKQVIRMVIIQKDRLSIKQYKQVLCFHEEKIDILLTTGTVHIYGEKLEIYYFNKEEIEIKGKVRTVTFL